MKLRELFEARSLPNENSLGRPITNNPQALRNFWTWFKGSKVIDANKRPLVMYHGTIADFPSFSYEFADNGVGAYGMGFYFTTMPNTASGYAAPKTNDQENVGGNVIPCYLNITKPMDSGYKKSLSRMQIKQMILMAPNLDMNLNNFGDVGYEGKNKVLNSAVEGYFDYGDTLLRQLNSIANDFFSGENESFLRACIAITGFNGVVHKFEQETYFVAWDPSQIKSAIGNTGNYSAGGMVDETLNEAISLTTERHTIFNKLDEIGKMTLADGGFIEKKKNIVSSAYFRISEGSLQANVQAMLTDIVDEVTEYIVKQLEEVFSNIAGRGISVKLFPMKVNGSASYDTVSLSLNTHTLESKTMKGMMELLDDPFTNVFYVEAEDGITQRVDDIDELYKILSEIEIRSFFVWNQLRYTTLPSTKIHELVHIIQHGKQPEFRHRKNKAGQWTSHTTEYRSKLSNQERFLQAVRNLGTDRETPEDTKLYYSSLQEIPAHAHNAAIQLIDSISFPESGKLDSVGETTIRLKIKALSALVKDVTSNSTRYGKPLSVSSTLQHYHTLFNKPNEPKLYEVYKRFIKVLYQELSNYVKYWTDQLPQRPQQYSYDVYLNGEVIDTVYSTVPNADDVRHGLINHDGHDDNIKVVRRR